MKRFFTKEVIIGICVISAIVILFIGIEFLKGINVFKPANFYVAKYENVAGLEVAAPVTIDGFKVGQVRSINYNYEHPGLIEVELALNKKLHIPEGSRALIGSTLLSGSYVEIQLGKSDRMIPVGGEIMSGATPDLMSSVSNDLLPAVSSIMPKIDSLLLSLNRLAGDPALLASIQSLETITKNVSSASESLNRLMKRDVPGVIAGADNLLTNLDSVSSNLNLLSLELTRLPLSQTMTNVNELTANLSRFSDQLNDPNSTLGLLTHDPALYDNLRRVTADVDSLIVDIKKNPKRYISIKLL
ncbi:MAG: MCE family protein [Muribaculaceae bacterium]|nr:MCE family protein [Muribaculaceae bacterium]